MCHVILVLLNQCIKYICSALYNTMMIFCIKNLFLIFLCLKFISICSGLTLYQYKASLVVRSISFHCRIVRSINFFEYVQMSGAVERTRWSGVEDVYEHYGRFACS